jgi:hypothetical protein
MFVYRKYENLKFSTEIHLLFQWHAKNFRLLESEKSKLDNDSQIDFIDKDLLPIEIVHGRRNDIFIVTRDNKNNNYVIVRVQGPMIGHEFLKTEVIYSSEKRILVLQQLNVFNQSVEEYDKTYTMLALDENHTFITIEKNQMLEEYAQ